MNLTNGANFEAEDDIREPLGFGAVVCDVQNCDFARVAKPRKNRNEMIACVVEPSGSPMSTVYRPADTASERFASENAPCRMVRSLS